MSYVCVYMHIFVYVYMANENITTALNFFLHLDLIIFYAPLPVPVNLFIY